MDFTALFIVVLMILAAKSGLLWIAGGLGILMLVTSKGSYSIAAAVIGVAVVAAVYFLGESELSFYAMVGGLGLVLAILARKDSEQPSAGYYPPGV
ncbi:hypothetical protein J4220_02430 [Candidatus Micrarchaeota archaeon]|nr:hypothetical protein [Candidatus Micrarchaeota archaeon]